MSILRKIPFELLLILAVVAFYLPWLWHPTAGLTAGGYDLAEWVGLHPASRQGTPPLVDSFFVRAEMLLLVLLVGLDASRRRDWVTRWLLRAVGLVLALTLFPPLEFLTVSRGDVNYQQQFVLGLLAVLILLGTIWSYRLSPQGYHWLAAVGAALALLFGLAGALRSATMLSTLGITYYAGVGIVLLSAVMGVMVLLHLYLSRSNPIGANEKAGP